VHIVTIFARNLSVSLAEAACEHNLLARQVACLGNPVSRVRYGLISNMMAVTHDNSHDGDVGNLSRLAHPVDWNAGDYG
jgi:hypothetical protein